MVYVGDHWVCWMKGFRMNDLIVGDVVKENEMQSESKLKREKIERSKQTLTQTHHALPHNPRISLFNKQSHSLILSPHTSNASSRPPSTAPPPNLRTRSSPAPSTPFSPTPRTPHSSAAHKSPLRSLYASLPRSIPTPRTPPASPNTRSPRRFPRTTPSSETR